jgi:multiple sugar transport system permease protein
VFRTLWYAPYLTPPVAGTLAFVFLLNPGTGPVNTILGKLGLPQPGWFNDPTWSKPALTLLALWTVGDLMIIFMAALLDVPKEQYEAAELDGANLWQRLRFVTIPQTRFVLLIMMLMQIVATMQVFTEPYVMTGGGPEDSTVTVLLLLYRYAFIYNDFGTASALSLLLFVALGAFSALYLRLTRTRG